MLTYRRLRRDETDAAALIHRRGMATVTCRDDSPPTPEEDRDFYREVVFAECEIIGAFAGDVLVGHVAWRPGWIDHLYVDPRHQGRGIGDRLVGLVRSRCGEVRLWTFEVNRGARRFYERLGFVAEARGGRDDDSETAAYVRYRWRRPARIAKLKHDSTSLDRMGSA